MQFETVVAKAPIVADALFAIDDKGIDIELFEPRGDRETGLTGAVRPGSGGPNDDPGYSYWADGRGWENAPGRKFKARSILPGS